MPQNDSNLLSQISGGQSEIKCPQGHSPTGDSRGESFLPLLVSDSCIHFSATSVDSIFASVFTWTFFLCPLLYLEVCSSFDLGFTQETQDDFIPNSLTNYIFKAFIADKDIFKDSRDWRVELFLGGEGSHSSSHYSSLVYQRPIVSGEKKIVYGR